MAQDLDHGTRSGSLLCGWGPATQVKTRAQKFRTWVLQHLRGLGKITGASRPARPAGWLGFALANNAGCVKTQRYSVQAAPVQRMRYHELVRMIHTT